MPKFNEIANNLRKIDINSILKEIFTEKNIQSWVVETIQNRLYEKGVDIYLQKLRTDNAEGGKFYSERTIDIKNFENKKYSSVTLKDSGEFYNSMRIILTLFGFEIDANFQKENGHIYKNFTKSYASQQEFSNNVMSLTENELFYLMENKVIPKLKIKLNEHI